MNIYIPIEIKVRELEGRTLLAIAAAERGHTVIVGEKKDTIGLAAKGKLPPGVIHMKSITPHDSMVDLLTSLQNHGHKITVQDEESGLLDESYDTFARLRFSERTLPFVDGVCTWGEYDKRAMSNMYPDYKQLFSKTGSPRVDFWREDFLPYFQNGKELGTLDGKPYIMIVSNFSGPLNVNHFWNIMARLRKTGYFDREEGRERHEFENAAYQTNLIGEFVFMIRELAKTYPDYNILVRPHPVESVEGWEKLIGEVDNVYINREGTISRWIRSAKVIIHNGCTSALEAAIACENRIAYRPIPHRIERKIPNKVSINVFSLEELNSAVKKILNGVDLHALDENKDEIDSILNDRFAGINGKLATDRIVDIWDKIEKGENVTYSRPDDFLSIEKKQSRSFKKKLKFRLAKIRNQMLGYSEHDKKNKKLLKGAFKFPEFTEKEFETLLKNLQSSLNRFHNVDYERFGPKSFILYNKSSENDKL